VQMIGRVLLLYKRHPHSPRYEGKRAKAVTKPAKPGAAATRRGVAPSRSGKERGRRPARAAPR
jgi:hypothetical protein